MKKLLFTSIMVIVVLLAGANVPGDNSPETKAFKNFSKTYRDASDVKWDMLRDGRVVCRFVQNGVMKRAIYNGNGGWVMTIAGYTEEHLPKDVWRQVHSVYYDFSILYASEINISGNPVAYLVQVRDKRTIRIVRVVDGEMEEIQEIETL
jgi:hypothetical protein